MTFITGVINATSDVRSETERIQIMVKIAVHRLGMRGVRWEKLRDELSSQAN